MSIKYVHAIPAMAVKRSCAIFIAYVRHVYVRLCDYNTDTIVVFIIIMTMNFFFLVSFHRFESTACTYRTRTSIVINVKRHRCHLCVNTIPIIWPYLRIDGKVRVAWSCKISSNSLTCFDLVSMRCICADTQTHSFPIGLHIVFL